MTELRALTGARGIAAWFVVLYHLRASLGVPEPVLRVLAKGYLAVDFFFLLSGFVIWLSYAERLRVQRWQGVPTFLLRRVARIWPLHLVMLSFALLIVLALAATGRPADPRFPLDMLPVHMLLLQNWPLVRELVGVTSLDWNDPAWSISSEMFAYLLFPLLAMAIDWTRTPTAILLLAIGMALAVLAWIMLSNGMVTLGQAIPYFGQIRCVTEFFAGTAIGALWMRSRDCPAFALGLAAAVSVIAFALSGLEFVSEITSVPIALAGTLLAIALTSTRAGNPLGSRIIHYLGEISFATYLSHSLLWTAFKMALVGQAGTLPPLTTALLLMLILLASVTLYHLIERPAQRWINGLQPRRPARV